MNIKGKKFVRFENWKSEKSYGSDRQYSPGNGFYAGKALSSVGAFCDSIQEGWEKIRSAVSNSFRRGWETGSERIKSLRKPLSLNSSTSKESDTKKKILDPQGPFLQLWNKIFVIACVIAVALDPLFFYIPVVNSSEKCLGLDKNLETIACVLRTFIDVFYILRIVFQFQTGFIAPNSRVFGRGELVDDPILIARRYLTSYFLIDILAILPLPQIVVKIIIPSLRGPRTLIAKEMLKYVIFGQYVPRLIRIYPLYKEIKRTSGFLSEKAWIGAAYNLFLYLLASHIFGAIWYLIAIEREDRCWRDVCKTTSNCDSTNLYCGDDRPAKYLFDKLNTSCQIIEPDNIQNSTVFNFGIFFDALNSGVVESESFLNKLFYCFWWGLRNLSSLGQNLKTSTFVGEILFAVTISISGLILFSLLIGNMQKYLQSTTVRIEEMRVKRRDAEQWMSHRMLPENLKERIRRYEQYRWQETRGVEERALIHNLPKDLRRDINRHLSLDLLKRVPMFEKMDDQILDAVCDRLKPGLYTKDSFIVREGDPVDEMLFIMRGKLMSVTTNGGRTGFYNAVYLKAGDFCGEGLLTWALDPQSSSNLPISTRTVQAITEVEAFALGAEDLKSVASQFRRLHHKDIQHTFRFCSVQWKTWAVCFIQAAWRRYSKRKHAKSLRQAEDQLQDALATNEAVGASPSLGATIYVSKFTANALRNLRQARMIRPQRLPMLPQKPAEPDFSSHQLKQ